MKKFVALCFMVLLSLAAPRQSFGQDPTRRIVSVEHKDRKVSYKTPMIPYPLQARTHNIEGTGVLRVSFDDKGQATKAEMVKSTGHSVLDDASIKHAKAYWSSLPGNASVLDTTVVFLIR